MGYKVTCRGRRNGDVCMKIQVGDYEVNVAFETGYFETGYGDNKPQEPRDIIIFNKEDDNVNNMFLGDDSEYYPVYDFNDILNVVKKIEEKVGGCCVICNAIIDKREVFDIFSDIFFQADSYGVDSLTEHQQVVYEFRVCSEECYEKLE